MLATNGARIEDVEGSAAVMAGLFFSGVSRRSFEHVERSPTSNSASTGLFSNGRQRASRRGQRRDPRVVRALGRRYDHEVSEQTQALLSTALRLTVDERAELAAELLASLDGEPDADVEAAWAAEIERRARRVMQEGSRGRTWEQVRDDLRRRP